ncbi:4617_t:CDS:2, partial [Ambispora leptoticha]
EIFLYNLYPSWLNRSLVVAELQARRVIMWTNEHLRLSIDERKLGTSNIMISWVLGKFQSLVKDYNSMCQYIAGSSSGKRSRTGERYFEDFRTRFWERP